MLESQFSALQLFYLEMQVEGHLRHLLQRCFIKSSWFIIMLAGE